MPSHLSDPNAHEATKAVRKKREQTKKNAHMQRRTPATANGEDGSDQAEECATCRIVGSTTFAGASAYILYHRAGLPRTKRLDRAVMGVVAFGFGALAVVRATVPLAKVRAAQARVSRFFGKD